MTRILTLCVGLIALAGCVSVVDAREGASQRSCRYEARCGNVGSGQRYPTAEECLVAKRSDFQDLWPSDKCDGRINGETLNICYQAIENTQCDNLIDLFATLSKCESNDVCTAGAPKGCNCGNGETCCNNACTNLQSDRNNCGGCGTTCGSGLSCQSGVCR